MGKWFKQFEALIWAITIAMGFVVFIFQAFATRDYVDAKHESVVETLRDIKSTLERIDQRTFEISRGIKR